MLSLEYIRLFLCPSFAKRSIRIRDSKFGLALVIESSQQVGLTINSAIQMYKKWLKFLF